MKKIAHYLSLIKFSHTIFAMPFALTGFCMGISAFHSGNSQSSLPGWKAFASFMSLHYPIFIYVILCMVFARSAAMAFNRYLDREFDARNPRTAIREIPSGIISPASALRFTLLNGGLFMLASGLINTTCLLLSPIALLIILGYSFTKRFTPLCHLVLGTGLALAPVGAFIAVTESVQPAILLLSVAVICWVSGFDIIYALQDEEFDQSHGLRSIPAALGAVKALRVSQLLHILTAGSILLAGYHFGFHWLYFTGAAVFILMLIWQHRLVKPGDLSRVNIAFMTTNGLASILFSITAILDLLILQ